MTDIRVLHRKWMEEPAYRSAYDELDAEFELAHTLIEVRSRVGLTQEESTERITSEASPRIEQGMMPHR
uniref:Uncharacterized protein n=1 Tax=Candidatus Kentrum sp. TC TaxID=2126339 RepID=A0A450ZE28_9GAMM|nr:MAG: hypothetical protein BECKTC1821D_GA0114238_11524 [Candidatus Kentron sp. TC]VFK64398.1 MAG: hypothetical protein BECKTC1821F_GA0114240_11246 [Candidatus Kentron sp. TC]